MVSRSKTSTNLAFCLTAMFTAASGAQAQLSNIPVRLRNNNEHQEFRRQQRQHGKGRQHPQRQRSVLEASDGDVSVPAHAMAIPLEELSMPLEVSGVYISMPADGSPIPIAGDEAVPTHVISIPLEEPRRSASTGLDGDMSVPTQIMSIPLDELSMPLEYSGLEMSMPADGSPTPIAGDEAEVVSIEQGANSGGGAPLLASFLAGITALVIGAVVFFVKIRKKFDRQFVQEREEGQLPEGPSDSMVPYFDPSEDLDRLDEIDLV